jgi:hypothetical protein
MTYSTPPIFADGAPLTAAELNVLGDDILALRGVTDQQAFAGVSLKRTTNQSIASASPTAISWGAAPVMQGGTWWSSGGTILVPAGTVAPGWTYAVLECGIIVKYAINGVNSRGAWVTVNGTTADAGLFQSALPADDTVVQTTAWALVKDGDTLQGMAWQQSGGPLNVTFASLHVKRIGYA